MANLPEELKQFLARYDEKPQSLALKLREIVVQELAPCHEYIFAMEDLAGDALRDLLRQARSLAGLPSLQDANQDNITTRVKRPARTARRRLDYS